MAAKYILGWLVILLALVASGCATRVAWPHSLEALLHAVEEHRQSKAVVPAAMDGFSSDADGVKPEDLAGSAGAVNPWPYSLSHGRVEGKVIIWEIRRDASGIHMPAGRVRMSVAKGQARITGGNPQIVDYLIHCIAEAE